MIRIRNPQDLAVCVVFVAMGAAALWFGRDYDAGTAAEMGPGYFPALLGMILIGLGLMLGLRGLSLRGPAIEPMNLRVHLFVLGAVLLFGVLIGTVGLAPTAVAMTVLAALAGRERRWLETAVLGLALAAAAVAVFIWGLDQPMTVLGR